MNDVESVGRLLPSPTGKLHLGHARTFLLAYWHARSRHGKLVLRIEDLDAPRVVPGAADQIVRDLVWLGLDWDGPVVLQSEHIAASNAACDDLVARGLAYACVCSRGDLRTAQSAPQAGVAEPRYPGTCLGKYASVAEAEHVTGKPAGVRFRVPEGRIELVDSFAGPFSVDIAAEVGDFLIARKGGLPAIRSPSWSTTQRKASRRSCAATTCCRARRASICSGARCDCRSLRTGTCRSSSMARGDG